MNKFMILIICMILNISICSAKTFGSEHAAIGGIATGANVDYIKSVYGEPNKIKSNGNNSSTWYYGDTFMITIINDVAVSIITSGNNGLLTPDGIGVGMKKSSITSKYGKAQSIEKYGNRAIYIYEVDGGSQMYFIIKNGMITEIRLNLKKVAK